MARDDSAGNGAELQKRLWLADALERLPIAIGLIDDEGKYIALSGAMKDLFGHVIPSRNADLKRMWQVFDDNGNLVDPSNWPSERILRGAKGMTSLNGIYLAGSERERRARLISTPFVDSTGQSRGLVVMYDNELEHKAQEQRFGRLQQRYVETLIDTIKKVGVGSDGDAQLAQRIIARTMGFADPTPQQGQGQDELSPREAQVLRLVAWGNSRKEISAQLGITVKTVEFHRTSAARKLDLKTRVDVVRYAVDQGWLRNVD